MNIFQIALRSFRHYSSTNLAIALGVAAATAVLTGALIVGESMRTSLRDLTLERLGRIDEMLVSDGFFRTALADNVAQTPTFQANYELVSPGILFPGGTVETVQDESDRSSIRRSGQVTVLGISDDFGDFDAQTADDEISPFVFSSRGVDPLEADYNEAIINRALADDLGITDLDVKKERAFVTVRVPKQTQMPADSALGRKTDLIESLVDLKVRRIIPNEGLGRFSLFPSQSETLNVFVPIQLLQNSLARSVLKHKSDPSQANVLLLSGKISIPKPEISSKLRKEIRPTLEDYGLALLPVEIKGPNPVAIGKYLSLASDKMILTDETVKTIEQAFSDRRPVFTYLANDIRKSSEPSGVPFSMVAGIDFDDDYQLESTKGVPIPPLADNQIVLNEWTANDIDAKVGDSITLTFFEPETTHGSQLERTAMFEVAAIAKLAEPDEPFSYSRRKGLESAVFRNSTPTLANDPNLTPEVPGVTDAESIEDWDLPFDTTGKLRSQDDVYWDDYRTTPKAFVNLKRARELWKSRFGATTNYRLASEDVEVAEKKLLEQIVADDAELGLNLVSIKRRGLEASSGSTPFDVLFLALSMFVIGSALILVSLLFRLALQQRAGEVGLMKATGFEDRRLRRVWLMEMLLVSMGGALLGVLLGLGYAALMIQGLSTWWVGAISRPFLTMHIGWFSLSIGFVSGLLICVITIAFSLRRAGKQPVMQLLRGNLETPDSYVGPIATNKRGRGWLTWMLLIAAIGLTVLASQLSGEAQAGSFMGAGFLILTLGLILVYRWLKRPGNPASASRLSLSRLALLSAKRNPLRSTLTIGLVAVASFLIAAVSAFRLAPTEAGTAGFNWVAQSSQPIFDDLSSTAGQMNALGEENQLPVGTEVLALRYKAGEDASCNNLYQSTQPRALGVPPSFVDFFAAPDQIDFAWAGSLAETEAEQNNPWELLKGETHAGTAQDPIPVVLDKNTANYSLKIYMLGTVKEVRYDSGETIHVKVVGFLANTILQGSLIMSEADFVNSFPSIGGYRYFLIRNGTPPEKDSEQSSILASTESNSANSGGEVSIEESVPGERSIAILEDRLGDQGFDARSATRMLVNFMSVQNTYLSTFQTLGALGLLLGTFGLAAVQIRGVLERRRELGLLRAVGFELPKLSRLILLENVWLLTTGLLVGIGAALFTTVPHWFLGSASVPWLSLGIIFTLIAAVGLFTSWFASRRISRIPLLDSLRD